LNTNVEKPPESENGEMIRP